MSSEATSPAHPPGRNKGAVTVSYEQLDLRVDGATLKVAAAVRDSGLDPIVFLHGFGSTKEDYHDIASRRAFAGRPFLAYDAPGCGGTRCDDLSRISIPFLVRTAQTALEHLGSQRCHLVGHSMGGLTALLLAHQEPQRVLSFTSIEGNLAPEDCFLSRPILTLPCPRMFMYGEENATLSYLAKLGAADVELAEIPHSGHWPMYANPVAMWERIAAFVQPDTDP
jgi:pimeloyl-ACP methyl ester carboxylesterase